MCGDSLNWMCDECFGALQLSVEFEFCDSCAEKVEHMCFCCDTLQDEPVDTVCAGCEVELGELIKCAEEGGDVRCC